MTEREMIIAMIVQGYGVAFGPPDGGIGACVVKRRGLYVVVTDEDRAEYADPGNAVDVFLALVVAVRLDQGIQGEL